MKNLSILGEDERSEELRKLYITGGLVLENYSKADVVVAPIPLSRDNIYVTYENVKVDELVFAMKKNKASLLISGNINKVCSDKLEKNGIKYIDIMKNERFVDKNALATAEGTIKIVMENIRETLNGTSIAVLGYGRISKYLVKLLKVFGANITVFARKEEAILDAKNSQGVDAYNILETDKMAENSVIINTAPAILIDKNVLRKLRAKSVIVDIASNPGVDYIEAKKYDLKVLWELGIPSKYSPVSAAKYIKDEIDDIIKDEVK